MSVLPGSIHARITPESVSGGFCPGRAQGMFYWTEVGHGQTPILSLQGVLWYFRRPNLLSSISSVLFGPIYSGQPSKYSSSVSLQNIPQSAIVRSLMFALDFGRSAAQDAVCEVRNLEGEFILLRPRSVPNGSRPIAPGSSYHPSTSPSETIYKTRVSVPGHVATARITLHLTAN